MHPLGGVARVARRNGTLLIAGREIALGFAIVLAVWVHSLPAAADSVTQETGEGFVDIVAWPGYIERGASDPKYDWVTGFEKRTGCLVRVKTASTSDEMVALMNEGGFDVATVSGDATLRLIAGKRVKPIDIAKIPLWNTIDDRLQNASWHTVEGVHYGVPYQWGTNVLMYNTEVFKEPPDSWKVVFEPMDLPDGKPNKGRVQAFDGAMYIADAALYLKSSAPELGIVDPYELDEKQYRAALELLRGQRKIVSRYWHDAFMQVDDFVNEGVVASSSWPFMVNLLVRQGKPIASTVPKEGATGWADTTMVHVEAPHPICAQRWLEHSLDPKLQGDLAAYFGSVPAVPAACEDNPLLGEDGCKTNGIDNFDNVRFWRTPRSLCDNQRSCVPYYRWVTDYIAILGGR
jgi:putative spermidine/putrescine transport system substrate-binding protein